MDEIKKLQGAWGIVALEMDGRNMTEGAVAGSKIVVKGARFTTIAMGAEYEGTVQLDGSRTPKTIDLLFTSGPEKGNKNLGIYELDGDTWKICIDMTGKKRPARFATEPGSGWALETLRRENPASGKSPDARSPGQPLSASGDQAGPIGESAEELAGEWRMVSGVRDGHPLDASLIKNGKRIATGNETTVLFGGQAFLKARYAVDRSKTPMTMDYVHTEGMAKGLRQYGIYELSGNRLTLCFAAPGQTRPGEFGSAPGDGRTFTVWALVKR